MSRLLFVFLVTCCLVVGCGEKAVVAPAIDPAGAAEAAIQEYDADGDGKISASEAKKTALDPKRGWDADGDGSISAEEIQARLERYESLKPGIQTLSCTVKLRGQFLENAHVVFEPESFQGAAVEQGEGTTDDYGLAEISSPAIMAEDPTMRGIRAGLYKVRITHPEVDIPKKYNENTIFFFELSPMDNVLMPTFVIR